MTHIKTLMQKEYLGEWDLPQDSTDLILTISGFDSKEVTGDGNKKSVKPMLYWKEPGFKPMVLNSTNAKAITKALETPYAENWIGQKIALYRAKNIKAFGELMDAVRVRRERPQLPELTTSHERYPGAIQALKAGTVTIDQIKTKFRISNETLKQIENDIKTV